MEVTQCLNKLHRWYLKLAVLNNYSSVSTVDPMALPPGLSCEQYYLYLASGYTYSSLHGIMYLSPQAVSPQWISTVVHPQSFRQEEIAFFLTNRCYYDFGQRGWTRATFVKSEQVQERMWREASHSQQSFIRLQRKADDVSTLMASMTLTSKAVVPGLPVASKKAKPSVYTTMRDRTSKLRERAEKVELRKVQVAESKHRSRRSQAVKEKVKTLPASMSLNPGYWKTVL